MIILLHVIQCFLASSQLAWKQMHVAWRSESSYVREQMDTYCGGKGKDNPWDEQEGPEAKFLVPGWGI
jgi:hypothetical protein